MSTPSHTLPETDLGQLQLRAEKLAEAQSEFLDALFALRRRHGLTQQEVADRLGVSQAAVCKLEREDSNPTLGTLRRYALAVGATLHLAVIDDCSDQGDRDGEKPVTR